MTDHRKWTPQQLAGLRKLYPDMKAAAVAQAIGRPEKSVYAKARELGIGKSEAFKKSWASGRIQAANTDPRMVATRFKPGHTTWNKGKPGTTGLHENCRATQFKPGQKPHTTQPVGSYRINKTKGIARLEQKTNERPGPNSVRWIPVTRLVWEQHHGQIPPKHIVIFKDSRLATVVLEEITVDKLICITRAQNAARNHPSSRSPELAKLTQLKGAITRQVNRITRESQKKATP